jgi:hypothetical protein
VIVERVIVERGVIFACMGLERGRGIVERGVIVACMWRMMGERVVGLGRGE